MGLGASVAKEWHRMAAQNARAETLAEKPTFRKPFQSRRCLIPADGFYEWRKNPKGKSTPYHIRMHNQDLFAMAGLWECWRNPAGTEIQTFAIITTEPNELMKPIHNRMPAIVPREGYALSAQAGAINHARRPSRCSSLFPQCSWKPIRSVRK